MSKAFTKEDDLPNEPEADEDDVGPVPAGSKNYMTWEGAERLRTELRGLLNHDRPETVRVVSWAAGNGDRSENGDYIYGKKKLREIDRRIRFLQRRLDVVEIVESEKNETNQILFGAWSRLRDEAGLERTYRIVGVDETDPRRGFISWLSPMAKALLQSRVGDAVTVRTPRGDEDLEILEVWYRARPDHA
ncbi:MAG: transcription elongation factor GreB [Cryobacterium sp.]|nr:transcription elongation factor GreB [Oligoflexia bacterium]